jgi:integrase
VQLKAGRFRRRFETLKEAKGYEAYVKATGEEPAHLNEAKLSGPTFKETVVLMRSSKKSKKRDPSGVRRLDYIVAFLGDLPLRAITTSKLDALVADLEKRPAQMRGGDRISSGTINRYLTAFSGVMTWARARVKDGEEPLSAPVVPWRKEAGRRIHWFSDAQEEAVVGYLEGRGSRVEALCLRVLCATGMRWGEFSSLEAHQCQPEWVLLDETKTDTPRDIPIVEDLGRELKALVVSGAIPEYEPMRTCLRDAVKACGYSPKLGIHCARHACATRLIKSGASLAIVQKFLGHKDIKTTTKYVHVEADDLMQALKNRSPRRGDTGQNEGRGEVLSFVKSMG